ncbi:peptidoglycan-binding protein [Candidatus Nomurabacteria bacterium]|nr:peptidoglycan-binding protein [Candidatus Nomurabacteria bacterium]
MSITKKIFVSAFIGVFAVAISASAAYYHTTTLKQGSTGAQVMSLQQTLNMTSCKVATVGAGAPGLETSTFGPKTKVAVQCFQASNGLTADGIVGAMTGAKLATVTGSSTGSSNLPAGCTSTSGYSPLTGVSCSTGSSSSSGTLSGEGSVKDFSIASADKSDISEGQKDVELVSVDVELENDGDLSLDRFDLYMGELNGGAHSSKPWKYFDSASVFVGGKEVASMDVSSSSAWSEYSAGTLTTTSQEYRLRFSGLNAILESDETTNVSVRFDAASTIDSADQGATWQYGIETDSFRFTDGTGFIFTDGEDLEDDFTIDTPEEASLTISSSSNDPDASVIEVSDSSDTNGVTIGVFEIEEDEGVDVTVKEMTVTLATSDTITDVARKAYLYEGSTLIGSETVTGATVTFDNINLDIDADDTVEVTVKVDLDDTNNQVRYQNGDTIQVTAVDLTKYEDEFGNDEGDFTETGSFAGKVHTLYTDGIGVAIVGSPTTEITTVDSANNDIAQFTWVVDVTAFGKKDVYINKDVADIVSSSTAGDVDTLYSIEYSAGAALTSQGGTIVCTSNCSNITDNVAGDNSAYGTAYNGENFFKILKGKTARFTITVSGTNQTDSKQVRALLNDIEWTVDEVTSATAMDGSTATINSYTVGLGSDAATPFKVIN